MNKTASTYQHRAVDEWYSLCFELSAHFPYLHIRVGQGMVIP